MFSKNTKSFIYAKKKLKCAIHTSDNKLQLPKKKTLERKFAHFVCSFIVICFLWKNSMISAVQTRTGGDIVTPVTPGDGVVSGKFRY